MIEHVYRRSAEARRVDRVVVATDDERIRDAVVRFGGECLLTSPAHRSGTDRVAEVAERLGAELVVNVQGDEPLVDPDAIDAAVEAALASGAEAIATLRTPIRDGAALWDPNVVKVVADERGYALYFSRWPIPFPVGEVARAADLAAALAAAHLPDDGTWYRHIGLYVFPAPLLARFTRLAPSGLERAERLEQLRALEAGIPIRLATTEAECLSVDTPEDLEAVRRRVETGLPGPPPVREEGAGSSPCAISKEGKTL